MILLYIILSYFGIIIFCLLGALLSEIWVEIIRDNML